MNGHYLIEFKKIIKNKEVVADYVDLAYDDYPNNMIKSFEQIKTISKQLKTQIGGERKNITLNGNIFTVDMVVQKAIKGEDDYEIYYYNLDNESITCGVIQINEKTKKAFITGLSNFQGCLMCDDKKFKYKTGEMLMQLMLQLCVKKKIISIKTTDNSKIDCKGLNDKFELIYLRTMTHGEPYYIKFGFVPYNVEDQKIYDVNKKIFNTATVNTQKITAILNFFKNENNVNLNENKIKMIVKSLNKHPHIELYKFINYMFDNYPIFLRKIYKDIYNEFGYKSYSSKVFVKRIKY